MKTIKEIEDFIKWLKDFPHSREGNSNNYTQRLATPYEIADWWFHLRQEEMKKIKSNIGMLRQWLNERPKDSPLVTNEQLEKFLFNEYEPVDNLACARNQERRRITRTSQD